MNICEQYRGFIEATARRMAETRPGSCLDAEDYQQAAYAALLSIDGDKNAAYCFIRIKGEMEEENRRMRPGKRGALAVFASDVEMAAIAAEPEIDTTDHEAVKNAVSRLPAREQAVIWARYWRDQPGKETAKALCVSRSRVVQIHGEALQRLKGALS